MVFEAVRRCFRIFQTIIAFLLLMATHITIVTEGGALIIIIRI